MRGCTEEGGGLIIGKEWKGGLLIMQGWEVNNCTSLVWYLGKNPLHFRLYCLSACVAPSDLLNERMADVAQPDQIYWMIQFLDKLERSFFLSSSYCSMKNPATVS